MSPSIITGEKTYSIASIPADGIGPEVIGAGITVLNALTETLQTFKLTFHNYDWSSETYKKTGKYIPDGGLEELKKHDAIFFGAVGAPGESSISNIVLTSNEPRRPRPHLPLGPPSSHMPTPPTIRERTSHARIPRDGVTTPQMRSRRPGLGDHPREQRRRVRRTRRTVPYR